MLYDKVSTDLNFVDREQKVLEFWKQNEIFKKSIKLREGQPRFTWIEGPPTANGKPHIGHVETRSIKDLILRYRVMKGYDVLRKGGWDTHGLPVELEVEKQLGISGKPQIEEYGVEPFIKKCKESVWKYSTEWEQMSDRVAFWADMDNPYVTYHDTYIESEWWALKKIWEKGLLYKGHKVVPYCPDAEQPFQATKLHRATKTLRSFRYMLSSPLKAKKTNISLHGQQHPGHFHPTLHSA